MTYTVHWEVNDGRFGYPNIQADLDWSDIECRKYTDAIRTHAQIKGVNKILSISKTTGKGSKGKIRGRSYRDYLVEYLAKDVKENEIQIGGKEIGIYTADEVVSKVIRVFGSYSGKSKSL